MAQEGLANCCLDYASDLYALSVLGSSSGNNGDYYYVSDGLAQPVGYQSSSCIGIILSHYYYKGSGSFEVPASTTDRILGKNSSGNWGFYRPHTATADTCWLTSAPAAADYSAGTHTIYGGDWPFTVRGNKQYKELQCCTKNRGANLIVRLAADPGIGNDWDPMTYTEGDCLSGTGGTYGCGDPHIFPMFGCKYDL